MPFEPVVFAYVGIDTFRPVRTETLDGHEMHGERFAIHRILNAQERRQNHDRKPGRQPVRENLAGHERFERIRRQRDLLERAIRVVRGEKARQRQQRRKQRRDPEHAGTHRREQRALGRRRERE